MNSSPRDPGPRLPQGPTPPPALGGGAGELLQDGQDQEEHLKSENVSDVSYLSCISEHYRLFVCPITLVNKHHTDLTASLERLNDLGVTVTTQLDTKK